MPPLESERGVQTNWNVPTSVATALALPVAAPIGCLIRVEDTGFTWQWSGLAWVVAFAAGGVGSIAQTRFVDKAGNDTTGDGSFANPFLTIQRAYTSITTASATEIWRISVGVGTFVDPFVMTPWIFLHGAGRNLTTLSPVQANWIGGAAWAAGAQSAGIIGVRLNTNLTVNFALVASTGAGAFSLYDALLDGMLLNFTGNNATNIVFAENVQQVFATGVAHQLNNILANWDGVNLRSSPLTINNTATYAINAVRLGNSTLTGSLSVICASAVNNLTVNAIAVANIPSTAGPVITGDGAALIGPLMHQAINTPDADFTFEFLTFTAPGAIRLVGGGTISPGVGLSANRIGTCIAPPQGTRMRMKRSDNSVNILNFASGSFSAGGTTGPSYLGQASMWDATFSSGFWMSQNVEPQSGPVVVLAGGVSPFIPADIVAGNRIHITRVAVGGGPLGELVALEADKTAATRAGGGGFLIRAISQATGVQVATDNSTVVWTCTQNRGV